MKSFTIHAVCVFGILGLAFPYTYSWWSKGSVFIFSLIFFWILFKVSSKRFHIVFILISFFLLGFFRSQYFEVKVKDNYQSVERYINQVIEVTGVVEKDPVRSDRSARIFIKAGEISTHDQILKKEQFGFVFAVSTVSDIQYGDVVRVRGSLRKIRSFKTDANRWFDYPHYLSLEGYFFEISSPEPIVLSHGSSLGIGGIFYSAKKRIVLMLGKLFEEPYSALAAGLLVGEKRSLGKELADYFRRSGLMHIVVLSGYNVTIVLNACMFFFKRFSSRVQLFGGIISIISFAFLTGASTTTIRASVMAGVSCVGLFSKRKYDVSAALFISAFIMACIHPRIVPYDPAFHLSCISTFALIYISPFFERFFNKIPEKFHIREIFTASCSTQLFALPYLFRFMGEVSYISIFPNLLVLPLIPLTMVFSFIAMVVGFIWMPIAWPIVGLATVLLWLEIAVVSFFGKLSFGMFSLEAYPEWLFWLPYIVLVAIIFYRKHLCFLGKRKEANDRPLLYL